MSRQVRRAAGRGLRVETAFVPSAARREPLLIGPPCGGKSTLARLIAERSGRRVVCLDALRHALLPVLGCDLERAEALARHGDHAQWCRYVRPFEHLMLEWVLEEHRDAVFDVGAGYVLPIDEPREVGASPAADDVTSGARCNDRSARLHGAGESNALPGPRLPRSLASCLASFAAVVHVSVTERQGLVRLHERHGEPRAGEGGLRDVARYYARRADFYSRLATIQVSTDEETPAQTANRIEAVLAELSGGT